MATAEQVEQHRLECEARHWNRKTNGDKHEVRRLISKITRIRGEAAANKLLHAMRDQWSKGNVQIGNQVDY